MERNGWDSIIQSGMPVAADAQIAQLTIGSFFDLFVQKNRILNAGLGTIAISPLHILLLLVSLITPRSEDLYLDNIVLASKKN